MKYLLMVSQGETFVEDDLAYILPLDPGGIQKLVHLVRFAERLSHRSPAELIDMTFSDDAGAWILVDVHEDMPYSRELLSQAVRDKGVVVEEAPSYSRQDLYVGSLRVYFQDRVVGFECEYQGGTYAVNVDIDQLVERLLAHLPSDPEPVARPNNPNNTQENHGTRLDAAT